MPHTITPNNEEREAMLDALSMAATYLHEEAALAAQCFDDLGNYCPDDLRLCEPLDEIKDTPEAITNMDVLAAFLWAGIENEEDLASASSVDLDTCAAFWANPLRCAPKQRAQVMQGLEVNAQPLLDKPHRDNGSSVKEFLCLWMRHNFKTPYQFERQAKEYELKSYLIGAVGSLTDAEINNLMFAPYPSLKAAAAISANYLKRDREAAQVFEAAAQSACNSCCPKSTQ